ncbi:MAG: helix-turn-helix domain-containing protein [Liquorilactobacillus ghanensis]|uniref:helix-turn-helix domain-containing protein n=1 Tax=Liquorilactobacillus ghanensis TaxID=399370 RepID=UPI0039ECBCBF
MMKLIINTENIKKLLDDELISSSAVADATGLSRQVISKYRKPGYDIGRMTVENATKLSNYYDQLKKRYSD